MMPQRPELILVLVTLVVTMASWGWWCFPRSKTALSGAEPSNVALAAVPYSKPDDEKVISSLEPWLPPPGQRQGREWVYDVFTPPEIFYDASLNEFLVTPPTTEIASYLTAPAADALGVQLTGVKRGIFRLQLIGFISTDRGHLGLFENAVTRESFLATSGRSVPALDLKIEQIEVGPQLVSRAANSLTHQIHATAVVRDQLTGETVALTTAERCHAASPRATLVLTGSTSREREVSEGDSIEIGDSRYEVASIQLSPPSVTLSWGASDGAAIERLTLRVRPANTEETAPPSF